MSWNGPVGGAAPFQQQPYPNGPPPYGQQLPYQYGQQQQGQPPRYGQHQTGAGYPPTAPPHRAPHVQPPKKKGNPIITRYPPPPGYRGPAQPRGPFGANNFPSSYKPPQPGFPASSNYPQQGYPAQGYNQQAHQAPGFGQPYSQAQNNYQWPKPGYPPSSGYSQNSNHPTQPYANTQNSYQGYPSQSAAADTGHPPYGQNGAWPSQHNSFSGQSHTQAMLDPEATPTPATAHLNKSQPSQQPAHSNSVASDGNMSEKPQLFLAWDDWDFDFDGAIWPKSNEPVDPALSLGVIIWHPAKQVTRALPSTFAEAEEEALKPTPEKLDNGDSVSVYFTAENSHEAFLNVRQTDDWETIKDDPVFVVFTDEEMQNNLVTLDDCIAQRDRPDESEDVAMGDGDMEMRDATWDIMDNLEQALSKNQGSAASSISKRGTASPPQGSQEDILARLGVTGTPKPPSNEPMLVPRSLSDVYQSTPLAEKLSATSPSGSIHGSIQPNQRAQSYGGYHSEPKSVPPRPYGSMSAGVSSRPPPPPPPAEQQYDAWNAPQPNSHVYDNPSGSPAHSEASSRTMAGSDFEPEKQGDGMQQDEPTAPSLNRSDSSISRKRSYEDADQGHEKLRQHDDHSKRKRRSQVDAAYSRR